MHLVAMAPRPDVDLTWEDFDDLSRVVPLLARMYPNGTADVNHFHAAGGTAFLVGALIDAGLLHADVLTLAGPGLAPLPADAGARRGRRAGLAGPPAATGNPTCCGRSPTAFAPDGGLRMLAAPSATP